MVDGSRFDIGQTSVAKYMARRRRPPSQGWSTFLRNHADGIAAMDLFVVPTISFRLLYGLLILRHDRRRILWLGATTHPTAEWIARQLIEACGWKQAPHYLVHDRDRSYGEVFLWRVRAMGIRDRPTSPRSPWQNGYAERLIGSIRRSVSIMSLCLVNDTSVTCCFHTSSTTTTSHTTHLSMSLIQKGWAADILVLWGATGVCERARRGTWFLRVRGSPV